MRSITSNLLAISVSLFFSSFHEVFCEDSWSDDVNIVCSPSALEVNGTKACEEKCQLRACCFVDGAFNCRKDMESWCSEFSACDNLVKVSSSSSSENQQGEDQGAEEEGHTPVQEACEPAKLQDPDLLSRCEDICSTRRCCWGKGRDNCYDYDPHWCNEYKVCLNLPDYEGGFMHFAGEVDEEESASQQLVPEQSATEPPQQQLPSNYIVGYLGKFGVLAHDSSTNKAVVSISPVEDNCASEKVQKDGGAGCRAACSSRSCCFSKGSDNCAKEMPVECNSFRACWILYDRLH
jgi:hypothetical protein